MLLRQDSSGKRKLGGGRERERSCPLPRQACILKANRTEGVLVNPQTQLWNVPTVHFERFQNTNDTGGLSNCSKMCQSVGVEHAGTYFKTLRTTSLSGFNVEWLLGTSSNIRRS